VLAFGGGTGIETKERKTKEKENNNRGGKDTSIAPLWIIYNDEAK